MILARDNHDEPTGRSADLEARVGSHLDREEYSLATTELIRGYGPELLGFLTAVMGSASDADEAFAQCAEDLWRGIRGFRRSCSVRAWLYQLAWRATLRHHRDAFRRRARRLETKEISELVAAETSKVRRTTAWMQGLESLRRSLDPFEQALLTLRIDRELSWEEISVALSESGRPSGAPALRKRFERLIKRLKRLARDHGMLEA